MEQQLAEIREQQKESWNKFSPGWKKWDELVMDFLSPVSDEIIHLLCLKDTDLALANNTQKLLHMSVKKWLKW